jgi:hypothetical protein
MKKYLVLPVLLLGACHLNNTEPYAWAGRWVGPEGTYLELAQRQALDTAPRAYDIVIHDLDGARHYSGQAQGNTIVFTRNGMTETIRQGTGKDTGMKWLADKHRCLIVKSGEGYCRT